MYSDFDFLTNDFLDYKSFNNNVVELLKDDFLLDEVAEKINNCGDFLGFSLDKNGEYKLTSANFCRQRLCPMCQRRKSLKMYSNVLKVCDYLSQNDFRYIHLVLTVPNCSGGVKLQQCIRMLYKAFGKFYKYKEIQTAFKGCLRCLEISYNGIVGTFHPHLHCLIAVNKSYFNSRYYLSYDRIQALWTKAYGSEQLLQVSVGAIKGDYKKGVAEVCKYCVKPLNLKELDTVSAQYVLRTIGLTLKGQRTLQTYGVIKEAFKHLKIDNEDNIDNIEVEQMFDNDLIYFGYDHNKKIYRRWN